MNRTTKTTISVFTISIVVVIAGFFLLAIEKSTINYWAFGSLLFSLTVSMILSLTLFNPKINNQNTLYNAGVVSSVIVYMTAILISVAFSGMFKDVVVNYVFLQVVINAILLISVLMIVNVSRNVQKTNEEIKENFENGDYDKPKRGGI